MIALITGATSGIGKAISELFARKGITLILAGRNREELHHLQENLSSFTSVKTIQSDLSTQEGRQCVMEAIQADVPDIVINNAGLGLYGEALNTSIEEQVAILEVNGKAVLELTLAAARAFCAAKKKGVILNVSSAAAFQILPTMAVYAASKAFVSHFSQALDFELKGQGVRILTLCPGVVATNFQKRAGGRSASEQCGVMMADYVAEQAWKQINNSKALVIIDWRYRLLTLLSYLLPKSCIAAVVKRFMNKRNRE